MANLPLNETYNTGAPTSVSDFDTLNEITRNLIEQKRARIASPSSAAPTLSEQLTAKGLTGIRTAPVSSSNVLDTLRSQTPRFKLPAGTPGFEQLPEDYGDFVPGKVPVPGGGVWPYPDKSQTGLKTASAIEGQYLLDKSQPNAFIKTKRSLTQGHRKALLDGRPSFLYEVEHIIPLWAGGTDTAQNWEVLAIPEHRKKTKAESVPYSLWANGKMSETRARFYTLSWKDRDLSDIPNVDENGVIPLKDAEEIIKRWDEQATKPKKVTFKDFLKSIKPAGRETGAKLDAATEKFSPFIQGVVKGLAQGATAGWIRYSDELNDRGGWETSGNLIGNIAGMLLGIGKIKVGLRLVGKGSSVRKADDVGGLMKYIKKSTFGTKAVKGTGKVTSGSAAAVRSVRIKKTPENLAFLQVAQENFKALVPAFVTYGQISVSFEEQQRRFARLTEDIAYGWMTGFIRPTLRGSVTVGASASILSFMFGHDSENAAMEAAILGLTMATLHRTTASGSNKQIEKITDEIFEKTATPEAISIFKQYLGKNVDVSKMPQSEIARMRIAAVDVLNNKAFPKGKSVATKGKDFTMVDPPTGMDLETLIKETQRIAGAGSWMERRTMKNMNDKERYDVNLLYSLIQAGKQKSSIAFDPPQINITGVVDNMPISYIENPMKSAGTKASSGRHPTGLVKATGLAEGFTVNPEKMGVFLNAKAKGETAPTLIAVRRPDMERFLRSKSTADAEPGNGIQLFGIIIDNTGIRRPIEVGWWPQAKRIVKQNADNKGIQSGGVPPFRTELNKDVVSKRMDQLELDYLFVDIADANLAKGNIKHPYLEFTVSDESWINSMAFKNKAFKTVVDEPTAPKTLETVKPVSTALVTTPPVAAKTTPTAVTPVAAQTAKTEVSPLATEITRQANLFGPKQLVAKPTTSIVKQAPPAAQAVPVPTAKAVPVPTAKADSTYFKQEITPDTVAQSSKPRKLSDVIQSRFLESADELYLRALDQMQNIKIPEDRGAYLSQLNRIISQNSALGKIPTKGGSTASLNRSQAFNINKEVKNRLNLEKEQLLEANFPKKETAAGLDDFGLNNPDEALEVAEAYAKNKVDIPDLNVSDPNIATGLKNLPILSKLTETSAKAKTTPNPVEFGALSSSKTKVGKQILDNIEEGLKNKDAAKEPGIKQYMFGWATAMKISLNKLFPSYKDRESVTGLGTFFSDIGIRGKKTHQLDSFLDTVNPAEGKLYSHEKEYLKALGTKNPDDALAAVKKKRDLEIKEYRDFDKGKELSPSELKIAGTIEAESKYVDIADMESGRMRLINPTQIENVEGNSHLWTELYPGLNAAQVAGTVETAALGVRDAKAQILELIKALNSKTRINNEFKKAKGQKLGTFIRLADEKLSFKENKARTDEFFENITNSVEKNFDKKTTLLGGSSDISALSTLKKELVSIKAASANPAERASWQTDKILKESQDDIKAKIEKFSKLLEKPDGRLESATPALKGSGSSGLVGSATTPQYNKLPKRDPNNPTMTYAGVGSRETPPEILAKMTEIAKVLDKGGYTLNTGNAKGADTAFGAGTGRKNVFTAENATDRTRAIAREIHPNPQALRDFATNLHARNTNQIFGKELDTPVDFVLVWTKDGKATGGTGQAIRYANGKGIPVINLYNKNWRDQLRAILGTKDPGPIDGAGGIFSGAFNKVKDFIKNPFSTKLTYKKGELAQPTQVVEPLPPTPTPRPASQPAPQQTPTTKFPKLATPQPQTTLPIIPAVAKTTPKFAFATLQAPLSASKRTPEALEATPATYPSLPKKPFDVLAFSNGIVFAENSGTSTSKDLYKKEGKETGDLGKYQVHPNTLKGWSGSWLGRTYTPTEFLNDPEAQEEFFRQFLAVVFKYNLTQEEAAVTWHRGWGQLGDGPRETRESRFRAKLAEMMPEDKSLTYLKVFNEGSLQ